jgi:hypothetical protein
MTPRCRTGCGNTVVITGSKCGRCIRETVEQGRSNAEADKQQQLQAGLAKVRTALADARGDRP